MQTPTHIDSERECVSSTRLEEEWNFLKTLSLGYGHRLNEKKINSVTWHSTDNLVNLQDSFDEKKDYVQRTKTGDGTTDEKLKHGTFSFSSNRRVGHVGAQAGTGALVQSKTSCCHPQGSTVKASIISPEHLLSIQKENRNTRRALEKHVQINDENELKSLKRSSTTLTPEKTDNRFQRRVSNKIKVSQDSKSRAQRSSSLPSNQCMIKDDIDDIGVSACAAYQKKMEYFHEWYRERDHHQQMQKWLRHVKEVETTPRFREAFAHIKKNEDPVKKSQRIQELYDKCQRSFTRTNDQRTVSLPRSRTSQTLLNGKKELNVFENKVKKMNEVIEGKNRLRSNRLSYDSFQQRSKSLNKSIDGSRSYDTREEYKSGSNSNIDKYASKHSYSSYEINERSRNHSLAAAAIYPEAPINDLKDYQDDTNLCQYGKCFNIHGNLTGDVHWNNEHSCQDYACCPQHSNVAYPQSIMCPVHSTAPMYANAPPTVNPLLFPDLSEQHYNCAPNLSHYALHSITPVTCPIHQCISPSSYNTFGSFGIAVPLIKMCPANMHGDQQTISNFRAVPGSTSSASLPSNDNESVQDDQPIISVSRKPFINHGKPKLDNKSGTTAIKKVKEKNVSSIKKSLVKKSASIPLIRKLSSSTPEKEILRKSLAPSATLTFWKKANPRKLGTDKVLTSKKLTIRINSTNDLENERKKKPSFIQKSSDTLKTKETVLVNTAGKKNSGKIVVPSMKKFETKIPRTPSSTSRKTFANNSVKSQRTLSNSSFQNHQHRKSISGKTCVSEQSSQRSLCVLPKTIKLVEKNHEAQPTRLEGKTSGVEENELPCLQQNEQVDINKSDEWSNVKEKIFTAGKNEEPLLTDDSKVICCQGNKSASFETNESVSDGHIETVTEEGGKVVIGDDKKSSYCDKNELTPGTQTKVVPADNKQVKVCQKNESVMHKEKKSTLIEDGIVTPREDKKANYVKENTSTPTKNLLVTPFHERQVIYINGTESVGIEDKMVTPREQRQVVYIKENMMNSCGDKNCIVIQENNDNELKNNVEEFLVQGNDRIIKTKNTFVVEVPNDNCSTNMGKLNVVVSPAAYNETGDCVVEDPLTRNVALVKPMLLQKERLNYKMMNSTQNNQIETNKGVSNVSMFSVTETSSCIAEVSKTNDQEDICKPCGVENSERIGLQFEDLTEKTDNNKVSGNWNLTKTCENSNTLYIKNCGTKSFCIEKVSMEDETNQRFWTRVETCEPGEASGEKFAIPSQNRTKVISFEAPISDSLYDESKEISDCQKNFMKSNASSNTRTVHVRFKETALTDNNSITYCKYRNIENETTHAQPNWKINENSTPRVGTGTGLIKTMRVIPGPNTTASESSSKQCQTPSCFVFQKCNLDPNADEKEKICTEKSVFCCQPQKPVRLTNTNKFIADTLCEIDPLLQGRQTLKITPIRKIPSPQPYESFVISDPPLNSSPKKNTLFIKKHSPEHVQEMHEENILTKTTLMNCTGQKKLDGYFRPLIHENSPIFTLTSRRSHILATPRS